VLRARDRVQKKERELEDARAAFLGAIDKAQHEHSVAAVARELGVSRQRVQQILARRR
jgi:AcrR family transcriptional regulator